MPSPTGPRRWPSSGRFWTRPPAGAPTPVTPPWTPEPIPDTRQLLADNLRRRRQELGCGWSGLTHPGKTLAAVADGLRQLLASRGVDVQQLVQRAMVTISLHHEQPGQARGNQPGWMMVHLPLGEPDPARRLELIAAETAARKHKARPQAGNGIFRFVAGQRAWYRHFPRQRSVNLVVTNVAGPPVPLYLAGARLLELFPVMPVMGNLTLVVAVLSYAGQLNFAAAADQDSCPDLDVSPTVSAPPSTNSRNRCPCPPPEHDARSRRRSLVAQMQVLCPQREDLG